MALLYKKPTERVNTLEFPDLRQSFAFSCGASAAQSILIYYGINEREDVLMKKLGATATDGVKIEALVKLFKEYGLSPQLVAGMIPQELPKYTDDGVPVLVLLQAYKETSNKKKYFDDYKSGHWVISVGYEGSKIIFEDPAAANRTFLTFKELEERWHAIDDNNKPDPVSVAIVVKGKKKYNSNELTKMP